MDDEVDRPEPPSAKAVTARLREARSRRADKLNGIAAAVDDPTTQQLAAEACTTMEQLVHRLMLLERHAQRRREVSNPAPVQRRRSGLVVAGVGVAQRTAGPGEIGRWNE